MVRLALLSALSDRAALGRVALIDTWAFEEPKTKRAVTALGDLGLDGRVLVVLSAGDVAAERSFGNLPHVQVMQASELNTYDVLRNDWIVFTDDTLPGGGADGVDQAAESSAGEAHGAASDGDDVTDGADVDDGSEP
jgi:large subunit ribosomal protein L4